MCCSMRVWCLKFHLGCYCISGFQCTSIFICTAQLIAVLASISIQDKPSTKPNEPSLFNHHTAASAAVLAFELIGNSFHSQCWRAVLYAEQCAAC